MTNVRIILNLEDFEKLVTGQIVMKDCVTDTGTGIVAIILRDIGFDLMREAVDKAEYHEH